MNQTNIPASQWLVILTNLTALAAIYYTARHRKMVVSAMVFATTMIYSMCFHAVTGFDQPFLGLSYWQWLALDTFWSVLSLLFTGLFLAGMYQPVIESSFLRIVIGCLFFITGSIILGLVSQNAHKEFETMNVCVIIFVVIAFLVSHCWFGEPLHYGVFHFVLILCSFIVGGFSQLGVMITSDPTYQDLLHSFWHVCLWTGVFWTYYWDKRPNY